MEWGEDGQPHHQGLTGSPFKQIARLNTSAFREASTHHRLSRVWVITVSVPKTGQY